MNGKIHSLESFGTVDGPGMRFVIFLQGCPMRCLYCHNPDTWALSGGTEMTTADLLERYVKNISFYKEGGITVTGGEPLMQISFLAELFEAAKRKNIHTCIDSSGIIFNKKSPGFLKMLDRLLQVTDLILLDIKHIRNDEHQKLTSYSNETVLDFARYLDQKQIPVWIRHVVVPTITLNEKYLYETGQFIGGLSNVESIEVLPYHTLGISKYESLGIDYPLKGVKDLSKEDLAWARHWMIQGIQQHK